MTDYRELVIRTLYQNPPRIEAPLEGMWRLECAHLICIGDRRQQTYIRDDEEEDYFFCFHDGKARRNLDGKSLVCDEPYDFNPVNGQLFHYYEYSLVERLTQQRLVLCCLGEIGRGSVERCLYKRV